MGGDLRTVQRINIKLLFKPGMHIFDREMAKTNNVSGEEARKQFEAARLRIGEDIYDRLSSEFSKTSNQQTV